MDYIHKVLSGTPETKRQLRMAGIVILLWMAWDGLTGGLQLYDRYFPTPVICEMVFPRAQLTTKPEAFFVNPVETEQPKFSASTSIPGWYYEFMLEGSPDRKTPPMSMPVMPPMPLKAPPSPHD